MIQVVVWLIVLVINAFIGHFLMAYFMMQVFAKPLFEPLNTFLGMIFAEVLIPIDIVICILQWANVLHSPFLH